MSESYRAQIALGDLQGIQSGNVIQFRGVPYAEPPIGELRFAPPRPVAAWNNLRDARVHGPVPPQPPSRLSSIMGDFVRPQSEDCLTLTISTPAADGAGRPVLIWLHGGAYLSGAGSLDWYDGTRLAGEGNMVVVGVNYRLGPLGFLYQPGISNGKLGLQDVIAALEWVQKYIHSFGGDPHKVTIAGQSAGAHMIQCMLALPETRHLFQRAIIQSSPTGVTPMSEAAALVNGNMLVDFLQIERGQVEEVAARLKAESPARLIEAMGELARATARFAKSSPPLMPVIDELSEPRHFLEAAATGAGAAGIDLIVSTTREEAHAFFCNPGQPEPDPTLVAKQFVARTGREDAFEQYRHRRPGGTPAALLSDLETDMDFLFPSLHFAEAASHAGARTWVYEFDWAPPASPLGACHCLDIPFAFGNWESWQNAPMLRGTDPAVFAALSEVMRSSWISFAQTGNPATFTPWPQYEARGRQTMRFGEFVGPVGDPGGMSWRA